MTPSLSSSKKLEMAISSKRPCSEQGAGESSLPSKRRSFILFNQANTPRGGVTFQFLKNPDCFSLESEDDEGSQRTSVMVRSSTSDMLNATLVEAVGRYSDSDCGLKSDQEHNYQLGEANVRRKSLSRPGSFSTSSRKSQVSKLDLMARERCFDYIVQSIDEVWARYCDTTSSAEAVVYNNLATKKNQMGVRMSSSQSHKPLNISDNDTEFDSLSSEGPDDVPSDDDDESCGYKSEATNPTEYENETDYGESRTVSNLPDSVKLQSLKHRLTKAKSDLELVYDSTELEDSCSFWRRWDMIKYSSVEMMEDDDDDEIIESTIEELEQGRCYTN